MYRLRGFGDYAYNPSPGESTLLAQIRQNESGDNYTNAGPGTSTASGAYQFINGTWAMAAAATGVGGQYASASQAPAIDQDINALWLLRTYGPNSTASWAASGPYDTSLLTDSGSAVSTDDVLSLPSDFQTLIEGDSSIDPVWLVAAGLLVAGLFVALS